MIILKIFETIVKKLDATLKETPNLVGINPANFDVAIVNESVHENSLLKRIKSEAPSIVSILLIKKGKKGDRDFDHNIEKPFLPAELLKILQSTIGDKSEPMGANMQKEDSLDDFDFNDDEFSDPKESALEPTVADDFNLDEELGSLDNMPDPSGNSLDDTDLESAFLEEMEQTNIGNTTKESGTKDSPLKGLDDFDSLDADIPTEEEFSFDDHDSSATPSRADNPLTSLNDDNELSFDEPSSQEQDASLESNPLDALDDFDLDSMPSLEDDAIGATIEDIESIEKIDQELEKELGLDDSLGGELDFDFDDDLDSPVDDKSSPDPLLDSVQDVSPQDLDDLSDFDEFDKMFNDTEDTETTQNKQDTELNNFVDTSPIEEPTAELSDTSIETVAPLGSIDDSLFQDLNEPEQENELGDAFGDALEKIGDHPQEDPLGDLALSSVQDSIQEIEQDLPQNLDGELSTAIADENPAPDLEDLLDENPTQEPKQDDGFGLDTAWGAEEELGSSQKTNRNDDFNMDEALLSQPESTPNATDPLPEFDFDESATQTQDLPTITEAKQETSNSIVPSLLNSDTVNEIKQLLDDDNNSDASSSENVSDVEALSRFLENPKLKEILEEFDLNINISFSKKRD